MEHAELVKIALARRFDATLVNVDGDNVTVRTPIGHLVCWSIEESITDAARMADLHRHDPDVYREAAIRTILWEQIQRHVQAGLSVNRFFKGTELVEESAGKEREGKDAFPVPPALLEKWVTLTMELRMMKDKKKKLTAGEEGWGVSLTHVTEAQNQLGIVLHGEDQRNAKRGIRSRATTQLRKLFNAKG